MMFSRVLIANRGEVALRINSTLARLGIEPVTVYTYSDRGSAHAKMTPISYLLEDGARTGYLDGSQIIAAALSSGAQAIHPGYGFLAESAEFARGCEEAGIVFIGPSATSIAAMGEKISARARAIQAGVPVVPGISAPDMSERELLLAGIEYGFPLLIKPAAGGGGKGLHIAREPAELEHLLPIARREALSSFGESTLYLEKYLSRSRHIEFQIVADNYGEYLHLGERECSLQRRHQKVIEEAPSGFLSVAQRIRMGEAAIKLASSIGYQNIGTIEFLVDAESPDDFYFMEMNTRLQVEHRVTEMITGLDLVECQLRIASGEQLKEVIPSVQFKGHAVEARIYAEDAYHGFLPTEGRIGKFEAPVAAHTITDSAIIEGQGGSTSFDPMLAKVSCWGQDRAGALANLQRALTQTVILGITTNIDFLIEILEMKDITQSRYDTNFLEALAMIEKEPSPAVFQAFAGAVSITSAVPSWKNQSWRLSGLPSGTFTGYIKGKRFNVELPTTLRREVKSLQVGSDWWIHHPELGTWQMAQVGPRRKNADQISDEISSPMPGTVVTIEVAVGDEVGIGDALLTIEAMKMEHVIRAKQKGTITACSVAIGSKVRSGEILMEVNENV